MSQLRILLLLLSATGMLFGCAPAKRDDTLAKWPTRSARHFLSEAELANALRPVEKSLHLSAKIFLAPDIETIVSMPPHFVEQGAQCLLSRDADVKALSHLVSHIEALDERPRSDNWGFAVVFFDSGHQILQAIFQRTLGSEGSANALVNGQDVEIRNGNIYEIRLILDRVFDDAAHGELVCTEYKGR